MGSRGAFVDVDTENFTFVEGGQRYFSLGTLSYDSNIKVLIQNKGAVKAPEYSHTPGRVYAIVQDGKLKHLAYYDGSHKQQVSIDLLHSHGGVIPHVHYGLSHSKNDPGKSPTEEQMILISKIKKEFHLL